ncbi:replication protein A, subunit RPA32 [Saitoella complicata NRRL Y-17804]|uniref:Replication protein A C-terminal domain-containing protein n=1 Tax=Saitoella complicata (strain BCRC 22490 / CBS 7301 / JCM 7358 / NBRC 10748 / NRRL Y-17804) TaxID=698492 RepID=A0A0E9NAJ2_SAICN|nr:replication protein A, subunit RPA32 [Saitoella complicata NRRL Y-17804]ODQ53949.1 replication protein A, subunit RPA32 [Saitoella complicata NRRL Y-17804]GAO46833.1 hypothetical protein G7K_1051-t1 [Saitoella complicata NRRL Y-17804]
MNSYTSNYNPYQQTSYGGNAAPDGGGFMQGGGFGSPGMGGSPGSGGRTRSANTLRPVTIKQILDAQQPHPDADFRIDNADIGQITFVAAIRNVSLQSTNVTFRMEDGTGLLEAKQWLDAGAEGAGGNKFEGWTDTYARVTGQLKSFGQRRHVSVSHIRQVTDMHEVLYHLLEATSVHLYFTRGPHQPTSANQAAAGAGGQQAYGHNPLDAQLAGYNLSPALRQIMAVIHAAPDTNEGIHVRNLVQMCPPGLVPDMGEAIEQLMGEGLLYTTIDDEHVKSTVQT